MNKVVWNDKWTGPDKRKHFVLCLAIGVVVTIVTKNAVVGISVSSGLALAKEVVWDWYLGKGTPSPQDFLVSVAGAVLGSVVFA